MIGYFRVAVLATGLFSFVLVMAGCARFPVLDAARALNPARGKAPSFATLNTLSKEIDQPREANTSAELDEQGRAISG